MRLRQIILGVPLAVLVALALLFFSGALHAQSAQNVYSVPDCQVYLTTTAPALPVNSISWDNRSRGCDRWTLTYSSYGFAGPLSLAVQSSDDNAGAPAAWANFAGTVVTGINPNTAATQAMTTFSGFYPWIKITLTATGINAGRVTATLYGYKERASAVSVAGTTTVAGSAALGAVPGSPMVMGGYGSGASPGVVAPFTICDLSAPITLAAAAGATQIVALAAAKSIRVCHVSMSMAAPVDIKLIRGTGANCVTGPADVTGVYSTAMALALDFVNGPVVVTVAEALCVNLGQAVAGGGMITYALF